MTSLARQHTWDLVEQMALARDLDEYPKKLYIAPVDSADLPKEAVEHLDKGMTILVMLDDASQCYFTPSSRLRRRVDRLCGRIRVRVEERPAQGPSRSWHAVRSREAFEREFVPGELIPV